jgi:hypothetical protein
LSWKSALDVLDEPIAEGRMKTNIFCLRYIRQHKHSAYNIFTTKILRFGTECKQISASITQERRGN